MAYPHHPLTAVMRALESRGWTMHQRKHIILKAPTGRIVSISVSPSGTYGPANALRDINRVLRELHQTELDIKGNVK